ncbi:MAG TPA: NapC/NirT family cytochrome c [Usitatibacteraceae bacterium]|nr:NapC/NirT family cytochrome c [Usitatibacteraceae bacterium]
MKITLGRRTLMLGTISTLGILAVAAVVATVGGIAGWEYSNSNAFCATMCHSVHPEEIRAHAVGDHARVNCVECHMGRNSTLKLMALKPTHMKELWGMIVGYERPLTSGTLRPSREACESCHSPAVEHHDSIAVKYRYGTDPESSESRTRLVLHTGMDTAREGGAKGVHWHIANEVSFVSLDPQRREIPWVQVKRADGSKTTYIDAESKATAAQISAAEPRKMACYDCHNSIGHPFQNPEFLVDEAIRTGKVDRGLPATKSRAIALITAAEKVNGKPDERAKQIDKLLADSAAKAATPPELKPKEEQFNKWMKDMLMHVTFEEKGFSWKSFPDHNGHTDTPGCFRCHDGKHYNEKGEAIRLQCTLCHNLPQVTRESGEGSVPSLVPEKIGIDPPSNHARPNFMHTHADDIGPNCEKCHGNVKFGRKGGGFCSNPACHGRTYPGLNLTVEPPKAPAATDKKAAGLPAGRAG